MGLRRFNGGGAMSSRIASNTTLNCVSYLLSSASSLRARSNQSSRFSMAYAGFLKPKRIRQWTFYKRDEKRIAELRRLFRDAW